VCITRSVLPSTITPPELANAAGVSEAAFRNAKVTTKEDDQPIDQG
jgi:hypothetical protein